MHTSDERSRGGEEQASSGFNLWGMAARLVDDVKKNAESIVSTIAETDWTKELSDIQQSLKEDTQQLETSVFVGHRAEATRQPAEQPTDAFSFAKIGQSLVTGTREWFEQVKHTVDEEIQAACKDVKKAARIKVSRSGGSALDSSTKYSRLESEISSIQRSSSTYCDEPEDEEDFARFVATFDIEGKKPEIDAVLHDNAFMAELHSRIVPLIVEHHVFWQRYFYRLHKLMEQHEKHRNLVIRTNQMDQSDISWDDEPPSTARSPADDATPPEHAPPSPPQPAKYPSSNNELQKRTEATTPGTAGLASVAAATAAATAATPPGETAADTSSGSDREAEGSGGAGATEEQDAALPSPAPAAVAEVDAVGGGAKPVAAAESVAASEAGLPPRGKQPTDSGNASSDWSVVSSPYQNTPAETPSQADGDGRTAGASPEQSLQHGPTPTPVKPGADAEPAIDDDDDDLDLDENVPLDNVVDEEIDEDWGEWD